jgi:hypothetical protein
LQQKGDAFEWRAFGGDVSVAKRGLVEQRISLSGRDGL